MTKVKVKISRIATEDLTLNLEVPNGSTLAQIIEIAKVYSSLSWQNRSGDIRTIVDILE